MSAARGSASSRARSAQPLCIGSVPLAVPYGLSCWPLACQVCAIVFDKRVGHPFTDTLPSTAGSPWPHMALLGVLLFGMVRSPRGPPTLTSLACLCLLLAAAFLALLQLRGLRMVMRLDGEGKLGMALIHHGPSVQGLAPGM